MGVAGFAGVLDHAAEAVGDHAARALLALKQILELELDAFLADVLEVGETDYLGRRFAFRVLAAEAGFLIDPLDAECPNLLGDILADLPAQPDEAGVVVEAVADLGGSHVEQLAQLGQLLGGGLEFARIEPDRWRRHAGGQDLTVAVEDAPPACWHLIGVDVAALALLEEEVGADGLDIDRPADHHREAQSGGQHQQAGTPQRGLGRQQRTVRILHRLHGGGDARVGAPQ